MADLLAREQLEVAALRKKTTDPVSRAILDTVQGTPIQRVSGTHRNLTVLFADIKNFTNTFEHCEPEAMVVQLGDYFAEMGVLVSRYGGILDAYTGDGLMAVFGLQPQHQSQRTPLHACQCALAMQEALRQLNELWQAKGQKRLCQGIGISTGDMFHAALHYPQLTSQTVLGNSVTLGARLEQYTRIVNAEILICETTYQHLTPLARVIVRDLGPVRLKGFSLRQRAYVLEALEAPPDPTSLLG